MRAQMLLRTFIAEVLFCGAALVMGQVSITTGSYIQDFGTADVSAWMNNVTYPGWYQSQAGLAGHSNISSTAPGNTGGFYTYECNGANDQKIGSRGSGSATTVRYGVVLRNQTGQTIQSVRVRYRGYQMSLAQNGGAINRTTFDYVVSPVLPAIGATATANVPALNFTQIQSSGVAGANQIVGYPCTQSILISGCIALGTPLAHGSYILLRWTDLDDPSNDHHMAIDDVQVDFDLTGTGCSVLLPVELIAFEAACDGQRVQLDWSTASERDNDRFIVERSVDGFTFTHVAHVEGAGNSTARIDYRAFDPWPVSGTAYYRLAQVDVDGTMSYSPVVAVICGTDRGLRLIPSITTDGQVTLFMSEDLLGGILIVVDDRGAIVGKERILALTTPIDVAALPVGVYQVVVYNGDERSTARFVRSE